MSSYSIHADGGARGNPGPAAIGVIIEGTKVGKKEYAEYLGDRLTNNEAEYKAAIFGLKKLKQLIGTKTTKTVTVEVLMDSQLVVRQMNGEYKIKDEEMKNFFIEIWNLKTDFKSVTFSHVPREKNAGADRLVNMALDKTTSRFDL